MLLHEQLLMIMKVCVQLNYGIWNSKRQFKKSIQQISNKPTTPTQTQVNWFRGRQPEQLQVHELVFWHRHEELEQLTDESAASEQPNRTRPRGVETAGVHQSRWNSRLLWSENKFSCSVRLPGLTGFSGRPGGRQLNYQNCWQLSKSPRTVLWDFWARKT